MTDLFVRRSADDYAEAFSGLHPVGAAWPRAVAPAPNDDAPRGDDEALSDLTRGLARVWGDKVDARAADLLFIETDPRLTYELLPDWERAFGLPDPCNAEALTLDLRRNALIQRLTLIGRQDPAFYLGLAEQLGYQVTIYEYRPVVCGETRCGDTRPVGELTRIPAYCGVAECGVSHMCEIELSAGDDWIWRLGPPNIRFIWRISVFNTRLTWLRAGVGQCGVDHMCEFGLATDLECLIRRLAPGHTAVIFDYSQVAISNG
jgi:uncharacterized protein YmfQ (DUF2313 family)